MREALLYTKLNGQVRCGVCRQGCVIDEGKFGLCGVRQNRQGKLYNLVYGSAAALAIDPIEKKPFFHFLPGCKALSVGTLGCNFACGFCQNWEISQAAKQLRQAAELQKLKDELGKYGRTAQPEKLVQLALANKCPVIAYTYNEPVIFFEYALDTSKLAAAKGIKNVFVTNGYASSLALTELKPYVQAMSIDLKAFSEEFYRKICSARLEHVLEGIEESFKAGFWIELVTLLIPGYNDSEQELKDMAAWIAGLSKDIPLHLTAFHPDYKMTDVPHTPHERLLAAHKIAKDAGLNYVYLGNVFDIEHESTYCPNCSALLIQRLGYSVKVLGLEKGQCASCGKDIPGVWGEAALEQKLN